MTEYWPIETPPNSLLPPYDRYVPAGVDERRAVLQDALRGVELGEYDRAIVEWLAGWDIPTVAVVASLIERAKKAGAQ